MSSVLEHMIKHANTGTGDKNIEFYNLVKNALDAGSSPDNTKSPSQAVTEFGKSCAALGALPATIYLIVKFEGDVKNAIIQNTLIVRHLVLFHLLTILKGTSFFSELRVETLPLVES